MRTLFIAVCFLVTYFSCLGQETKQFYNTNNKENFKETYTVLKSDKSIKHGAYKKEMLRNKSSVTGFYENNSKTGLWSYFNYRGELIKKGNFSNNKEIGIWEVYTANKALKYKYNFETKKVIDYSWDEKESRETEIYVTEGSKQVNLDSPPLNSLLSSIFDNIYTQIKYPLDAADAGKSGVVLISIIINADGTSEPPIIEESVFHSLDKEALRVVTNMSSDWIPAFFEGEAITSKRIIPITFRLS